MFYIYKKYIFYNVKVFIINVSKKMRQCSRQTQEKEALYTLLIEQSPEDPPNYGSREPLQGLRDIVFEGPFEL